MARRQYKYKGDVPVYMPDLANDPDRQSKDDPGLVKPGDVVTIEAAGVSGREDFEPYPKAAKAAPKAAPAAVTEPEPYTTNG